MALAHFQNAAQLDPDYLTHFIPLRQGVWTYVGRSYYKMSKFSDARNALEQAVSRHSQDFMARLYLGLTLIRQQQEKAEDGAKPFSLEDVLFALRQGIVPRRVAALIQQRGVAFDLTGERENRLRNAGADDQLIEEIKRIITASASRKESARGVRERGLREVEGGLTALQKWLGAMSQDPSYGRFWDPAGQIQSQVKAALAATSGAKIDWQKLLAASEELGDKIEEEIETARRELQRDIRVSPRR